MTQKRPIPDSYWVEPGRLLAGEYPGSIDEAEARTKLRELLGAGITLFLDLTDEADCLKPYRELLREQAAAAKREVGHEPMPIPDTNVPTTEGMARILDAIDAALGAGEVVYVHCWGGIGRTGAVVACYMVRHGRTPEEAIGEIARLRAGTPDGYRRAPASRTQLAMVHEWRDLDPGPGKSRAAGRDVPGAATSRHLGPRMDREHP
jgi:protein-tyrosine phosphatase